MSKEHVIEISEELEKRISGERRKSTREQLYKLENIIRTLRFQASYWLDQAITEEDSHPDSRLLFAFRARLHAAQEYLAELGEPVEPCSCGYCERKRRGAA